MEACWLFHKWGKWGKVIEEAWVKTTTYYYNRPQSKQRYVRRKQERVCERCGIHQNRYLDGV